MTLEKDLTKLLKPFIFDDSIATKWFMLQSVGNDITIEFRSLDSERKKISLSPVYRSNGDYAPASFLTAKQMEKTYSRATRIMASFGLTRAVICSDPTAITVHTLFSNFKVGPELYRIDLDETYESQVDEQSSEDVPTAQDPTIVTTLIENIIAKYEISIGDHPVIITHDKIYCVNCGKVFVEYKNGDIDIITDLLKRAKVDNLLVHKNKGVTSLIPIRYIEISNEQEEPKEIDTIEDIKTKIFCSLLVLGKSTNKAIAANLNLPGQFVLPILLQMVEEEKVAVDKSTTPNQYAV